MSKRFVNAHLPINPPPSAASPQAETSEKRPETGPMQFGNDWPGVFVRGDNAGGIVATLMSVVGIVEKVQPMAAVQVRGIMSLFDSSDARKNPEVQRATLLPAPVSPVEPEPPVGSAAWLQSAGGSRMLGTASSKAVEPEPCVWRAIGADECAPQCPRADDEIFSRYVVQEWHACPYCKSPLQLAGAPLKVEQPEWVY